MIIRRGDELLESINSYVNTKLPRKKNEYYVMLVIHIIILLLGISVLISMSTANSITDIGIEVIIGLVGTLIFLIVVGALTQGIGLIPLLPLMFYFMSNHYYKYKAIKNLLNKGKCHFNIDEQEKYFSAEFFVPAKNIVHKRDSTNEMLEYITVELLPFLKNYELHFVTYPISSYSLAIDNSPYSELDEIINNEISKVSSYLEIDIKNKGMEMSQIYMYLYCLENTIRAFIHKKLTILYGDTYLSKIKISASIQRKVQERKNKERNYKFISIRGNSDLYYMDFKELGNLITNNQELLNYFPNENWIKAKIEELGDIRNLIAHNSYVGKHELDIIKVNFHSILKQIEN